MQSRIRRVLLSIVRWPSAGRSLACVWVALGLAVAGPSGVRAADRESPRALQSGEAGNSIAAYRAVVARAQEEFDRKAEIARKKMDGELERAQAIATKEGRLDDAVAIREFRKENGGKQQAPAARSSGPQVIAAFYGQNVNWLDVTDKVQAVVGNDKKWTAVISTKDLGDPAPGWGGTRTLLVRYTLNGRVAFKAVYEGKEISIP